MDIDPPSSSFKENVPLARAKWVAVTQEAEFGLSVAAQDDDRQPKFPARRKEKKARPLWLTNAEPVIVRGCAAEAKGRCWGGYSYVLSMKHAEISAT